ncbi:MAG: 50S ribosomal protein L9 [Syntrophobacterales bacterium]|nr:MAG: 50S ribosomal protein L9 [Syntrophobacterales bacterium]
MEIILLDDVPSLGKVGDLVKVSDGYGRNYLIPNKLAIKATPKNRKKLEHEKRLAQDKMDKIIRDAEKLAKRIEDFSCTISKPVGESGKLFGSVTSKEIEQYLNENGFQIDRKKIELEEPIKNLGVYTIPIRLHPEVAANLKLWVVKE